LLLCYSLRLCGFGHTALGPLLASRSYICTENFLLDYIYKNKNNY
jgi:hypothetical protein